MLIAQLEPLATLEPQLLDAENSLAFAPSTTTLLMVREMFPEFLSVTFWGELMVFTDCAGKVTTVGDSVAIAACVAPVPLRMTVCGLVNALSVNRRNPMRNPAAAGVKVTPILQLAPAARLPLQVFI
jgi:hypothetical protein